MSINAWYATAILRVPHRRMFRRDFYWEEIYGFVLRQPLSRRARTRFETCVDLSGIAALQRGGYLYADLAAGSDYVALPRTLFAARIPALGERRRVFASVLFPVDDSGDFDHVFSEAVAYDDGFARLSTPAKRPPPPWWNRRAAPPCLP